MSAVLVAEFVIDGIPVPQGSKTAFVVGARAVVADANRAKLKPWRALVTAEARAAYDGPRIEGAVVIIAEFRFVRPKSVKRAWPSVKPDGDKLLRSLLDAITDAGNIWRDDAQVVSIHATKVYAESAGMRVQIGQKS